MQRASSICVVLLSILVAFAPLSAKAQFTGTAGSNKGVSFTNEHVSRWRVGVIVKAEGGPCKGLFATIPVPLVWPEQEVQVVDEDVSRTARISHRDLGGVKQMLVRIPSLSSGGTAKALVTYEVTRKEIVAPQDTSIYVIPKKLTRALRQYLGPSPYIESRNARIRSLAKETVRGEENTWDQVEAIYDYVRDNVEYKEGRLKGAVAALRDGFGDCEELSSLFIAMCRAIKIPARIVWVPDHCYPEFYLVDDEGQGHWFPCQAAGTRAFGSIPEMRPILQKGDNFRVPEKKKPQRYVAEFLTGKTVKGGGRPRVSFVREFVQPDG